MKIQCLIVDDEPPARELLASYIEKMDDLEISGQCGNALEAFAFIQKYPVHILFLDIQMPRMNGLELIKSLQERPRIILTTAYREFAVEGFELDVLDYLVKPVTFERFLKSISKYHQYNILKQPTAIENREEAFGKAYMYFKVNKELVKIYLKEIIYIESIKDYVKIVMPGKSVITYQRIGYMEEKLPENKFVRIHKSYIISVDKIVSYNNEEVNVQSISLPIGRNFKQQFLRSLKSEV
ncbi:DNA-binding response regulator [Niastella yeongjuensis]|uniref:DNA-binding response regulator n=1 Tax=Niastella yeongjuensis TaxID=354355 RepID=A0A1V9EXL2_9BACT|nr:LytTR family DNA-binding domain-containing protein [Niastella yeongjuensis]OQP50851.1 DNA-binding response regulator [Niastella yeongjuensis]SEN14692.1 two component transcriptional regulator, LytTR family [Niastella yeongjuensis]